MTTDTPTTIDKVRFLAGTAVDVILRFDDGVPSHSQFSGDQYMYQLADGAKMFVPPAVRDRLLALGARAGDAVRITRTFRRIGKATQEEWQVLKLHHSAPEPEPAPEPPPAATRPSSPPPPVPASANTITQALRAAIEAAAESQQYASAIGYPVVWRTDDIRALAITLLIDRRKS